jgi:hypothetical protein
VVHVRNGLSGQNSKINRCRWNGRMTLFFNPP